MKKYVGTHGHLVMIHNDDQASPLDYHLKLGNHSPTGFSWGYGGSGPHQLAIAILFDVTGDRGIVLKYSQKYKWDKIAKFTGVQLGWLERSTESHYIFIVNPFTDLLGEVPDAIKKELNLPDPLNLKLEGDYLVGPDVEKAKKEFPEFIKKQEKDGRLLMDKSRHFEFLARLIKKGVKPFSRKPVDKEDLVERRCDFTLRDYQKSAWDEFLLFSNIGIFWPPSTGKTYPAIYACTHIKPPHLIAVISTTLVEQWVQRFGIYTDLKVNASTKIEEMQNSDVTVLTYQSAIKHGHKINWMFRGVDEVHHMPANLFSKLVTLPYKYGMGLTATPQREDKREEYVFAFVGHAIGLDWNHFRKLGLIQNPDCHLWLVKNENEKLDKLEELLRVKKKTMIFCDRIKYGERIAKIHDLLFVHGSTKEKLKIMQDNLMFIVSRVGDEGVSLPTIQRVIEVSWLFGSRRQELQRMTRLLHSKDSKTEHHIIMTGIEYENDKKRLFVFYDKGFKLIIHREGISDKQIQKMQKRSYVELGHRQISKKSIVQDQPVIQLPEHPILKLPGIQKRLSYLKPGQQKVVKVLFENEGKEFSTKALAMLLGYDNVNSFINSVNLREIVESELAVKVKPSIYKADVSLLGMTK